MNGFVSICKDQGMSSFDVIRQLRRMFPSVRMGHAGTLDPMATGVLPIAMGKATRLLEYVSTEPKVYQADMLLGLTSDTQDIWGELNDSGHYEYETGRIGDCLAAWRGEQKQLSPMYSARHYKGQRLYKLARQGIEVEREARPVTIYRLELKESARDAQGRPWLTLEISCSGGTYVRTLCHDIGQDLGTGAVMSSLCRLQSGVFTLEHSYRLEQIKALVNEPAKWLLPLDAPLKDMPALEMTRQEQEDDLSMGRFLYDLEINDSHEIGTHYRLRWQDNLIAIGKTAQTETGAVIVRPVKVLA
ncbi:MAG: tRNA pseudouridine(55) synthase TruB [Syntrophomonadaceae bacterium]|nr:tRNA pseudouridine(55) synthase TruB [Syntrophomonadaceae bacterium]